jgi:hypothetical protein
VLAGLAGDPGCLVEAGEHGQQPGATHQQPAMRVLGKEHVEGAQRLVCGPRPVRERGIEAEELRVALSVEAGVAECLLRHVRPVFEAAAGVRDCAERVPGVHQAAVVLCLLERRQDLPRESLELVDGRVGRRVHAVEGGADAGEQLARVVAGRACPLGGGGGDRGGLRAVPLEVRLGEGEVELEHDVEARRPGQRKRPLEQPFGGPVVAPPERAAAGGRAPRAGAFGQGRVGLSQLLPVVRGLLEVVAEDLVQLDQLLAALFEPGGEALVQLRPAGFRERVVGGVADQQVTETGRVLVDAGP